MREHLVGFSDIKMPAMVRREIKTFRHTPLRSDKYFAKLLVAICRIQSLPYYCMGGRVSRHRRRSISSGSDIYGYNPAYPPASPYRGASVYETQPSRPPHYPSSPSPYAYGPNQWRSQESVKAAQQASSYGWLDLEVLRSIPALIAGAPGNFLRRRGCFSTSKHPPSSATGPNGKRLERKFIRIADNYRTLEEVTTALSQAGLESSNLIVGVDFTKSNEWTGAKSFHRRSLHHIGNELNPYEKAISIIGKTLSAFDEDNLIPCFGFGDASTHDQDVFSFHGDERYCNGFEEVLTRYRDIVPQLRLAGPTSFAPIIEMAMTIVEESGGQYHVLLIIADGQVTRSVDTQTWLLSPQEQKTVDAIVKASEYPLSIILVGVGDGPWDMMKEFDDNIPARTFDNFQFVNFTDIMSKNVNESRKQTEFALGALMEIPSQYKATLELGLLGGRTGHDPGRVPLPPPVYSSNPSSTKTSRSSSFQQRTEPSYPEYGIGIGATSSNYDYSNINPPSVSSYDSQVCPICLTNRKDMAFGCGHQTCCECGEDLESCPICRRAIQTRIRLY